MTNISNEREPLLINDHDLFMPTSISWHNIEVLTKNTKLCNLGADVAQKEIVHHVSGQVKAGQFLAIMGSSGAGKTTLLNVLTARNLSKLSVKGVVKLNGQVANANQIAANSAYVQQKDLFIDVLTVREHLLFQASLRLDQKLTRAQRKARVEEVMFKFSLKKCSETRIERISGGESKRLAFASEVLNNPSLMFCDEPTSGLDSFMAENIVTVLKTMASQGRTVICTIHQPSSEVFDLFEQILLMSDGRVAYMGDKKGAMQFFATVGFTCPSNFNPGDFFIKTLSITPEKEHETRQLVHRICDNYINSSYAKNIGVNLNEHSYQNSLGAPGSSEIYSFNTKYNAGYFRQLSSLFWRSLLANGRDPKITVARFTQIILVALIIGIVFFQQQNTQIGVLNKSGAIFCMLINLSNMSTLTVMNAFTANFAIFMREHHNRMYRIDTYFITTVLVQIPIFTVLPIIFVFIYYFMVGLNPGITEFAIHLGIAILHVHCCTSLGYFVSCVSTSVQMAATISGPIIIPLSLFGGYFLNSTTFPSWLSWMKYISWYHYTFEAMIINQWQNVKNIPCDHLIKNSTDISDHCLDDGPTVIKYYGFDENDFAKDLYLLVVLSVVLQILAFIGFWLKSRKDK